MRAEIAALPVRRIDEVDHGFANKDRDPWPGIVPAEAKFMLDVKPNLVFSEIELIAHGREPDGNRTSDVAFERTI